MFQTTLTLTRSQPQVRALLADCHALHVWVMRAFPASGGRRADLRVTFRVERTARDARVLVRSDLLPDWEFVHPRWLVRPVVVTPFEPQSLAVAGQRIGLRMLGNAVVSRTLPGASVPGRGSRGKRVAARDMASATAWFARQFARAGLTVEAADLEIHGAFTLHGKRTTSREPASAIAPPISLFAVDASAVAVVRDATAFATALCDGVGHGKAYGLGLLDAVALDRASE